MRETWRSVPGFVGLYEVSSLGRVRSYVSRWYVLSKPRLMSSVDRISLRKDGKTYPTRVSHLVAMAFLGPRPKGNVVRHLNDIRRNNRVTNIRYGTQKDNSDDAKRNGRPIGRPRKREKVQ